MPTLERAPLRRLGEEVTALWMTEKDMKEVTLKLTPDAMGRAVNATTEMPFDMRIVHVCGKEYAVVFVPCDTEIPSQVYAMGCVFTETWSAEGPVLMLGVDDKGPSGLTPMDVTALKETAELWTWRDTDGVPVRIRAYLRAHDTKEASLEDTGPLWVVGA